MSMASLLLILTSTTQFAGTTPCDGLPRRFLGIAASAPCERITWQLALSRDGQTSQSGQYDLSAVYGIQAQSAPGFVNGGTPVRIQGVWLVVRGTRTNPSAVAYRIATEGPARSVDFLTVGKDLIHLLDGDKRLAVGNAEWSYTLSRTGGIPGAETSIRFAPDPYAHRNAVEVFEGRTPCQAGARELAITTTRDCNKLKWRLTLSQDAVTGAPTTYVLEGTLYRDHPRTGQWAAVKDPATGAILCRLDPDHPAAWLSLFRADDNILFVLNRASEFLVGDLNFSYTLNRVTR